MQGCEIKQAGDVMRNLNVGVRSCAALLWSLSLWRACATFFFQFEASEADEVSGRIQK